VDPAAVGSNLCYDPIRESGDWKIQKKLRSETDTPEETAYSFKGVTTNSLLVVVASYNGGDGKRYQRINLTNIHSVALGDRWEGGGEDFRPCGPRHHHARRPRGRQRLERP
jgi:hypothetical protein